MASVSTNKYIFLQHTVAKIKTSIVQGVREKLQKRTDLYRQIYVVTARENVSG
jgi:hypothetical protein